MWGRLRGEAGADAGTAAGSNGWEGVGIFKMVSCRRGGRAGSGAGVRVVDRNEPVDALKTRRQSGKYHS